MRSTTKTRAYGSYWRGTRADLEALRASLAPLPESAAELVARSLGASPNITVNDKVRELVWIMLPSGTCSIEQVAQHLGAGAASSISCQALSPRHRFALRYLPVQAASRTVIYQG